MTQWAGGRVGESWLGSAVGGAELVEMMVGSELRGLIAGWRGGLAWGEKCGLFWAVGFGTFGDRISRIPVSSS